MKPDVFTQITDDVCESFKILEYVTKPLSELTIEEQTVVAAIMVKNMDVLKLQRDLIRGQKAMQQRINSAIKLGIWRELDE